MKFRIPAFWVFSGETPESPPLPFKGPPSRARVGQRLVRGWSEVAHRLLTCCSQVAQRRTSCTPVLLRSQVIDHTRAHKGRARVGQGRMSYTAVSWSSLTILVESDRESLGGYVGFFGAGPQISQNRPFFIQHARNADEYIHRRFSVSLILPQNACRKKPQKIANFCQHVGITGGYPIRVSQYPLLSFFLI